MKFKKGDRVLLSKKAIRAKLCEGKETRLGTVTGFSKYVGVVYVKWDLTQRSRPLHYTFLKTPSPPTHDLCPRCQKHQKTVTAQICGNCFIEVGGTKGGLAKGIYKKKDKTKCHT